MYNTYNTICGENLPGIMCYTGQNNVRWFEKRKFTQNMSTAQGNLMILDMSFMYTDKVKENSGNPIKITKKKKN